MRSISILTVTLMLSAFAPNGFAAIGVAPYVDCSKPGVVKFVARNTSSAPVEVPESSLPWNYSSKVVRLKAFKLTNNGQVVRLSEHRPVADYFGKKLIEPGQTLNGQMSLTQLFSDYDSAHKTGSIIVFYDVVGNRYNYVGNSGVIIVPKAQFLGQSCSAVISDPTKKK